GTAGERITETTPAEAVTARWHDPNVVLVLGPGPVAAAPGWVAGNPPGPAGWALPEAAFAHRDSMITNAEVRAVALARLGPRLGVALAAVERVGPALAALDGAGYAAEAVQLQANRYTALPDGTHRLAATNPVHLVSGVLR